MICHISMPGPRQPLIMFWLETWWNHVCWQMYVWAFASQVLNPDLRGGGGGVLLLLVMAKLRDCLVGGVCLVRDWFEVMLFWLPCSLGGVVFGHTYNEGHVFYLADILMQITLGIITIRRTKAKGAVVIDRIYFFGTQHSWHSWQFLENRFIFKPLHRVQNLFWFMYLNW